MNRTIAVESNLTPVAKYLAEKGYKVDEIDLGKEYTKNVNKYDAIVITGMNKDFLGVQDTVSKIPVIEAKGLTAEQVYTRLTGSLKH